MIIAIKGGQSSSPMITVRKVSNGVGVEIVVPVYSPMIEKVELVKRAKVKRSKLYYIREKTAKSLRFKFKALADLVAVDKKEEEKEEEKEEDDKEEEVKAEDKKAEEKKEEVKTEEKKEKEEEK
jgi:large subunit ribosomal protein L19